MALSITNSQIPVTASSIRRSNSIIDCESKSISSGRQENMKLVDQIISNRQNADARSLTAINKNMQYQRLQLDSMSSSVKQMKATVSKMHKSIITSQGKSEKHIARIAEAMEGYAAEFNNQLASAKFDNKFLLGSLKYDVSARTGLNADQDSLHMEIDALNPVVAQKKINTHFDAASAIGAKELRDFGIDNLTAIAAACQSASFCNQNASDASKHIKNNIVNNTKALQEKSSGTAGHAERDKVYQALISAFDPNDNGIYSRMEFSAPVAKLYSINLMNSEVAKIVGTSSELTSVVTGITRGMLSIFEGENNLQYDKVTKNIKNAINLLPDTGGTIGKTVIDLLDNATTRNNFTDENKVAALPLKLAAINHFGFDDRAKIVQGVVGEALKVALDTAIESATDLAVKSIHGSRDSGVGLHMHETLKVAATAQNPMHPDPTSSAHVHTVLHDLEESIAVIRNHPDAPTSNGIGVFENNEAFNHLKEVVKAGPIAIEDTLTAAGAIRAAVYVGSPDQALELSQINMRTPEEIKETEEFIKGLKQKLGDIELQIASYTDTIASLSDSVQKSIKVSNDINDKLSKTDIVKSAQKLSESMHQLVASFGLIDAGWQITQECLNNVRDSLLGEAK